MKGKLGFLIISVMLLIGVVGCAGVKKEDENVSGLVISAIDDVEGILDEGLDEEKDYIANMTAMMSIPLAAVDGKSAQVITTESAINGWYRNRFGILKERKIDSLIYNNVDVEKATAAKAEISIKIRGIIRTLNIGKTRESDSISWFSDREFIEVRRRTVEVTKTKNGRWRVTAMTPAEILCDTDPDAIKIISAELCSVDDTDNETKIFEYTAPIGDIVIPVSQMPIIPEGTKVRVKVKISTELPEVFSFIHYGINNNEKDKKRERTLMEKSLEGYYSKDFIVENENIENGKWNFIKIDLIDTETIINNGEYKSTSWRIPYKVR